MKREAVDRKVEDDSSRLVRVWPVTSKGVDEEEAGIKPDIMMAALLKLVK